MGGFIAQTGWTTAPELITSTQGCGVEFYAVDVNAAP
jgi:hypothetical protein